MKMKEEEEHQSHSLCLGQGGAGFEDPLLIDPEQEESGLDDPLICSTNMPNGGKVDQIGREANNSGQGGEERAHFDENQNKESNRDFINNKAEDPVVENFC